MFLTCLLLIRALDSVEFSSNGYVVWRYISFALFGLVARHLIFVLTKFLFLIVILYFWLRVQVSTCGHALHNYRTAQDSNQI